MTEKVARVTENTLIPLSLVITLAGGIFWLSTIHAKAEATATTVDRMVDTLQTINQRLSHIEGFMERQEKNDGR